MLSYLNLPFIKVSAFSGLLHHRTCFHDQKNHHCPISGAIRLFNWSCKHPNKLYWINTPRFLLSTPMALCIYTCSSHWFQRRRNTKHALQIQKVIEEPLLVLNNLNSYVVTYSFDRLFELHLKAPDWILTIIRLLRVFGFLWLYKRA